MAYVLQQNSNDTYIQIQNSGWYVGQFFVSYVYQGQQISLDSGLFYLGQTSRLSIPQGASNIWLKAVARLFGNFVVLYMGYVQATLPLCFAMYGTILNPSMNQVPCSGLGGNIPNQCCCCCRSHY